MKTRIVWIMTALVAGLIIFGCSPRSKYDRMLQDELASGVRHDSLFMGLYFGMPQKDFYTHCWMLNREGVIKQGTGNTTVEYELKDELKYPATMDYYPDFVQKKIFEIPVRFMYNGWAPWNKELSSGKLQLDVLRLYEEIYGEGFIKVKHSKWGMAYVKIDGNRRITIFKQDDLHVWTVFTDMLVKRELNDSTSKAGIIDDEITRNLEK